MPINRQQRRARVAKSASSMSERLSTLKAHRQRRLPLLVRTARGLHAGGRPAARCGTPRPIQTDAESHENQRLVLLGPQCSVTDGTAGAAPFGYRLH
jgi:hypothetical protein